MAKSLREIIFQQVGKFSCPNFVLMKPHIEFSQTTTFDAHYGREEGMFET